MARKVAPPETGLTAIQQNAAEVIKWRIANDLQKADRESVEAAVRSWWRAVGARADRNLTERMVSYILGT